jgi:hypothetical protein
MRHAHYIECASVHVACCRIYILNVCVAGYFLKSYEFLSCSQKAPNYSFIVLQNFHWNVSVLQRRRLWGKSTLLEGCLQNLWHVPMPNVQLLNSWWWPGERPETYNCQAKNKFGNWCVWLIFIKNIFYVALSLPVSSVMLHAHMRTRAHTHTHTHIHIPPAEILVCLSESVRVIL